MITKKDVEHIAELADIGLDQDEIAEFTHQFNTILDYFEILDQLGEAGRADALAAEEFNIMREDETAPSLPQDRAIMNAAAREDGFVKAPRVM